MSGVQEPENPFRGTIYEKYAVSIPAPSCAMVIADILPTSAPMREKTLSFDELQRLSEQAAALFRDALSPEFSFQQMRLDGFLKFAVGGAPGAEPCGIAAAFEHRLETGLAQTKKLLRLDLDVAASGFYPNNRNIYYALMEAQRLMDHFSMLHTGRHLIIADALCGELLPSSAAARPDLERQWLEAFLSGEFAASEQFLCTILDSKASSPHTAVTMKPETMHRLTYAVSSAYDSELLKGGREEIFQQIDQMASARTTKELKALLHTLMQHLSSRRVPAAAGRSGDWISKIQNFIEIQYGNPELDATIVGERFGLSTSYLSYLFRRNTGMKFIDYLHSVRLTKAKELLLQTDLTVQEIAARTGYHSRDTLTSVFFRYEGITPSQYRKK